MATPTTSTETVDTNLKSLHETVTEAMARFHVPGAAVGLIHEGNEHLAGFGVTNIDHPLPVDGETLFQIGSTTKTVTGTIVMRLVEMGKLDLDAPIRTYLPDLRLADEDVAARVTTRHLLTHTGGWVGDYFADPGRGNEALAEIVATLAGVEQLTPLGEIWSYNNAGFYLAGRVIEVIAGKPYEEVAKELVLDPLGMTQSFFFPEDVMTYAFAVGHYLVEDRPVVARPWALPRAAHPAGGITSSARDQMRYARFHMGDGKSEDGTRLLTPESMAMMQTPQTSTGEDGFVGLTWFIEDVEGTRLVQHGGGTNGQVSAFMMAPDRGFALTILTNANSGAFLRDVSSWTLQRYLGIREPDPVPVEVSQEELAPYVGRYIAPLNDTVLSLIDGALVMQFIPKAGFPTADSEPPPPPPPSRLAFYGEDRVVALDGPMKDVRGEFLRNPDGSIAWFRVGGRIRARQQ